MIKVKIWGASGSFPAPGPKRLSCGGNTPCIELINDEKRTIIFDAGTGIRALGEQLKGQTTRIDIFITHCHMDHIYGLGFFAPFYERDREVHVWGPRTSHQNFHQNLLEFLSPPLSPITTDDFTCNLHLHDLTDKEVRLGNIQIKAKGVKHVGLTFGYRIQDHDRVIAYIPDHEVLHGHSKFPKDPTKLSGFDLACDADLLLHDAQYTLEEYEDCRGWGHSAIDHAVDFGLVSRAKTLVTFSHNPSHTDANIEAMVEKMKKRSIGDLKLFVGREGDVY